MADAIVYMFGGTGITGYAISVSLQKYNKWRRMLNQMVTGDQPEQKNQPPKRWKDGEEIEIPGQGRGVIKRAGYPNSLVRIEDQVPFVFPNVGIKKPTPRKPRSQQSSAPRRTLFDVGQYSRLR
ncbi:MAG: hypothetical protein Q8P58_00590 [Candidatus Adlerbacteria bacterium]|nr:hypothetical protein [Candidatus Adlerbacteria bacterium]MDZ4226242.1 hypothetical protein [Patescibacteria group bacterium]